MTQPTTPPVIPAEPDDDGSGGLRLSVIGAGYLGATHAACMADLGF